MKHTNEIKALVKQYIKDTQGIDEYDLTGIPWHKVVAAWWKAMSYYKMNGFCRSLDELEAVEGMSASVLVKEGDVQCFAYEKGEWTWRGQLVEGMYKE